MTVILSILYFALWAEYHAEYFMFASVAMSLLVFLMLLLRRGKNNA